MRQHCRQLDASVGASGPHDFAVRGISAFVRAPPASTVSRPTFRDDRERPSLGRDRDSIKVILADAEAEYFSD
jgi:hypothetical protein